ncbi:DMT family transporter [uncultured Nisaea sp.]|jgi:drug/metabolite transporter (DMT)-like permease|uniref:DMT family transporter n=1 Tax=uncultured Nisaea sp. TaxID=538215 RepID=UPI0030ED3519|tara:strand:- start:1096 stop:2010 length:915 start_codon:yes stop_codon:yes gene_type:complete
MSSDPALAHPSTSVVADPRKGILLTLFGLVLFSVLNGVVKAQTELFPILQIMFFRNAFALPPLVLFIVMTTGWSSIRTDRPALHLAHTIMVTAAIGLIFAGYRALPLADATAINFAAPLIVCALSAPLLKEPVGRLKWFAVLVGFAGVMIMVRPGGDVVREGALYALSGTALSAGGLLLARYLSRYDSTTTIVFLFMAISSAMILPVLPFIWVTPTPLQLAGLVAMGAASGVAQYMTMRALFHASASTIAPMGYTKMIWALLIGYFAFGDWPAPVVLAGAGLVLLSTWVVYRKESAAARKGAAG